MAASFAAVAAGAGCGGDDGGPVAADYQRAAEDDLALLAGESVRDNARCLAAAWVESVGVERLVEAGVDPDDIDSINPKELDIEVDAERLAAAVEDCDLAGFTAAAIAKPAGSAMSAESRECLADSFRADPGFARLASSIGFDPVDVEQMDAVVMAAFAACPDAVAQRFIALLAADSDLPPPVLACMNDRVRAEPARAAMVMLADDEAAADAYGSELGFACANAR